MSVRELTLQSRHRLTAIGQNRLTDQVISVTSLAFIGLPEFVTESLFGYPGLGRLLLYGIQRQDLPLMQATAMLIVLIFSLSNLTADVLYTWLNPKIHYR